MKARIKNTVMKNGKRYVCRIYDNKGKTRDRYTIAFKAAKNHNRVYWPFIACNKEPFYGIGYHGCSNCFMTGRHLGMRVRFEDVPKKVQEFIMQNLGV